MQAQGKLKTPKYDDLAQKNFKKLPAGLQRTLASECSEISALYKKLYIHVEDQEQFVANEGRINRFHSRCKIITDMEMQLSREILVASTPLNAAAEFEKLKMSMAKKLNDYMRKCTKHGIDGYESLTSFEAFASRCDKRLGKDLTGMACSEHISEYGNGYITGSW